MAFHGDHASRKARQQRVNATYTRHLSRPENWLVASKRNPPIVESEAYWQADLSFCDAFQFLGKLSFAALGFLSLVGYAIGT